MHHSDRSFHQSLLDNAAHQRDAAIERAMLSASRQRQEERQRQTKQKNTLRMGVFAVGFISLISSFLILGK